MVEAILNPDEKAQLSFTGLEFSPDGSRIYLANVNGDIKVFGVGKDRKISPLFSIPCRRPTHRSAKRKFPPASPFRATAKKSMSAGNLSNRLLELDATNGNVLRTWDVGVAPFDVVLGKNKIYVSNWGGRRPDADSVTGPIGEDARVRVDARSIASEGSVSVIAIRASGNSSQCPWGRGVAPREILTGRHACALALSPNGKFLVVANAGNDTLSVIDTRTDKIVETICARQNPGDLFGAQPNALAFDKSGKKLFVCNGTQNAVAVFQFKPGASQLLGLIPVGWFPGAIAFDARDKQICVANIKQHRRRNGESDGLAPPASVTTQNNTPVRSRSFPFRRKMNWKNSRKSRWRICVIRCSRRQNCPRGQIRSPQPVPERVGEPSVFQHVIYIIKENRTYDQVLGDVTEGNGDADLCNFGERVTPNEHKFVREFTLLDNTYCSGILSADGHQLVGQRHRHGISGAFICRLAAQLSGGRLGLDGSDALAYSPAGFIWNDALAHGKTVRDFGEFTTSTKSIGKIRRAKTKSHFLDCLSRFHERHGCIAYSLRTGHRSVAAVS